jgi:hypothetical protein
MNHLITSHALRQTELLKFILAGKAIFTARGSEKRFTYRVRQPKFRGIKADHIRFVDVLTGPDNTSDYEFFGSLVLHHGRWEFRYSGKAKINENAQSILAFNYMIRHLVAAKPMPQVEVWHEGRCGCCGRPLTVPESIETGLGPECAKKFAA